VGNIRRHFRPGTLVFLTLVCHRRSPWLRSPLAKDLLLRLLQLLRAEHGFRLYAWAILDDHVHLLVSDPIGDTAAWVQRLKLLFVRRHPDRPSRVWQKRYWDHVVRDENDLHRHLDYIHHNPVKHGYARKSSEYTWSSFAKFARRGWYAPDWVAIAVDEGGYGET
jgi:putative transposase